MASKSAVTADMTNSLQAHLAKLEARLFSIDHNLSFGIDFKEKKGSELDESKLKALEQALAEQRAYKVKVESIAIEIKRVILINKPQTKASSNAQELKKLINAADEILNSDINNRLMRHLKSLEDPSIQIDLDTKVEDLNRQLLEATKIESSEITIVVLGKRGVGKSTFVNYIRGKNSYLQGQDPSIAETNSVQCTFRARPFYFDATQTKSGGESRKQDIKIWDYPGVGTVQFPKEEYMKVIRTMPVDAYLYLFKNQLSEDDIEILKAMVENEKNVFLIQTNADGFILDDEGDLDAEDVRRLVQQKWSQVREKAFDEYIRNERIANCEKIKYYLISCKYLFLKDLFDFDQLFLDLAISMPKCKMDDFMSALQAKSSNMFKLKHSLIKMYIPDWALRCAIIHALDKDSVMVEGFKMYLIQLIYRFFGVVLITNEIDDLMCQLMKIETNFTLHDFNVECLKLKLELAYIDPIKLALVKIKKKAYIKELESYFEQSLDNCLSYCMADSQVIREALRNN